jgi:hypothetical protein
MDTVELRKVLNDAVTSKTSLVFEAIANHMQAHGWEKITVTVGEKPGAFAAHFERPAASVRIGQSRKPDDGR